jgi:DNA-directed RNA polymerase subunit M/transcription elongation factor TFIIS
MKASKHELDPKNAELIEEIMSKIRELYHTLGTERIHKNTIDITIKHLKAKGMIKEEPRFDATTSPTRQKWKCPRCRCRVRDFPAISRRDNKTEICDQCGQDEAMFDFKMFQLRDKMSKRAIDLMREGEESWLK